MPFYSTFKAPKRSLNKQGYADYLEFLALRTKIQSFKSNWDTIAVLEKLESDNAYFLARCIESMGNYTDQVGFEISTRNIAKNDEGDLILLDCFFDKKKIKECYQHY